MAFRVKIQTTGSSSLVRRSVVTIPRIVAKTIDVSQNHQNPIAGTSSSIPED
jgi:hypothetical protein